MKRKKIEDIKKTELSAPTGIHSRVLSKVGKIGPGIPIREEDSHRGGGIVYKGPKRGKNLMEKDLHKEEAIKVDGFPNKSEHVALIDSRS